MWKVDGNTKRRKYNIYHSEEHNSVIRLQSDYKLTQKSINKLSLIGKVKPVTPSLSGLAFTRQLKSRPCSNSKL